MKYSAKNYARAILDLSEEKGEKETTELMKKFVKVLEKNNELGQLEKIKTEIAETKLQKKGLEKVIIRYMGHINKEEMKKAFGEKTEVIFEETPSLIGGVQIFVGDKRIDNSLAGRLSALKKIGSS